jgi:hypothetical protein
LLLGNNIAVKTPHPFKVTTLLFVSLTSLPL